MLKKLLVIPLALILLVATLGQITYAKPKSKRVGHTARVKAEIARRAAGKDARVTIKVNNGQQLKGRVDQASDSTFTITDEKSGKSTNVAYSDVSVLSAQGLSNSKKIGIIAALTMGIAGVVIIVGMLNSKKNAFGNGVRR